jgi:hypothetical protein
MLPVSETHKHPEKTIIRRNESGAAALQRVEEQNDYGKCYGLIDLLSVNHGSQSIV